MSAGVRAEIPEAPGPISVPEGIIETAGRTDASGRGELRVSASDVRLSFDGKVVLGGVDLEVGRGEFVALLGPSGTGKTSLLRVLAGLQRPDSGRVLVPQRTTFAYQEPRLVPSKRVLANVAIGLPRSAETRASALAALAEVGLAGRERSWPSTLSGGEAQRVALARALVRRPQLLLLDEPFAALDALKRIGMQTLVAELVDRHRPAAVLVTHDIDEAIGLADRIIVLNDGGFAYEHVVESPRPRDIGEEGLAALRHRLIEELHVR
ncbi:ABC transporter ATP-binding protein [Leucobacter sp. CSA1]|uniref:ABC transporter ATP-binding protein n=1 Tax=Leucobacter chromiisoli TaxID=2796471 RepID=A0A934Q8K8_9MICO|nr:ABC transporter ATP-binding protein [Leucobacter chromiisoli]MBK0419290.1 ABC transporter ATP-binding protein [Leucobacter chromiisoli]